MKEKSYPNWQIKGAMRVIEALDRATQIQDEIKANSEKEHVDHIHLAVLMNEQARLADDITHVTREEVDGYEFLAKYIPNCYVVGLEERVR